jgi:8-oxo-dGTP pyrophosphatase MutT (NUDIX family)
MMPYQPKHAATVILLRPTGDGGIEVFMTRRPSGMHFLGGMYVFPGGTIRKKDCSEDILERCRGLSSKQARKLLGAHLTPQLALGHWVAGIRELFEEVGILLCLDESGNRVNMSNGRLKTRLAERRKALVARHSSFQELLVSERLFCDAGALTYFSHWITPEEFSTRFDTRFYLAPLPLNQDPLSTSQEVTESMWITPEQAVQLCEQESFPVIFPTYASLRTLADFDSLQSLMSEYRR